MRAVQVTELTGPAGLRLVDLPEPEAGDGVRIEVHSAGVAFPDLLMSRGQYQRKPALPFVPGVELAGRVLDAPAETGLRPGDRIAAFVRIGSWAEIVVARPELTFPLPESISFRGGCGMPMNYLTAHLALVRRGALTAGEVLLVHGAAGGLGTALLQVGAALGARVIAVVSTETKAEIARAAGAHDVVFTDDWLTQVRDLVPDGVDVVADPVGGDRFLDSVRSLGKEGRVLVLGFADGQIPTIAVNRLLLKNVDVRGVAWGIFIEDAPQFAGRQWADLMRWAEQGFIRPVDGQEFALADAAAALEFLDQRSATGKVTLRMR